MHGALVRQHICRIWADGRVLMILHLSNKLKINRLGDSNLLVADRQVHSDRKQRHSMKGRCKGLFDYLQSKFQRNGFVIDHFPWTNFISIREHNLQSLLIPSSFRLFEEQILAHLP